MDEALWDVLEMDAPDKFYVENNEKPAFLLFPRWHWAASKTAYSLYLNRVGLINQFKSEKKALERLKEIVENANFPVRVYRTPKYGRKRGKRIPFAENVTPRLTPREGCLARVFNIAEWDTLRSTVKKPGVA